MNKTPAIVIFGFHGAGKSTLAASLAASTGGRVAALVEESDFATASAGAGAAVPGPLIFEAAGTLRPLGVLESLDHAHHDHEHDQPEGHDHVAVPLCITVVDATSFLTEWIASDALADRGLAAADDDRNVSDVLADQVEGADVIVLSKADRVAPAALAEIVSFLDALNPVALKLSADKGVVEAPAIVDRTPLGAHGLATSAGWFRLLQGDPNGLGFVYRARRPFHPERFWDFMNDESHGILRSKGFLWLATRPDFVAAWSQAGNSCQLDSNGTWWANTPASEWPEEESERAAIMAGWDEAVGDKRQELAFVGDDLDASAIGAALDACLLNDTEFASSEADWAVLEDPFPVWETHSLHEAHDDDHAHVHGPDCGHDHSDHHHRHHGKAEGAHVHSSSCSHPDHDHAHHDHAHHDHAHHDHAHHDHAHHDHGGHERETLSQEDAARYEAMDLQALGEAVLEELNVEHYGHALAMQEILVRKIPREDGPLLAMGRFQLAVLLREVGETHRALPLFREAIRGLEPLRADESWMLGEVVHSYGQALLEVDEPVRAEEVFRRGKQLATEDGQKAWASQFALELGRLRLGFDEPTAALEEFELANALREQLGDRAGLGIVAMHLGLTHERAGNGKAAREALERSLVLMAGDDELAAERDVAQEALARVRSEGLRSKLKLEF